MTSTTSLPKLRKDFKVYLIGRYTPVITGSKLPSKRQLLCVFFFNLREVKLSVRESSLLAVREVMIFWNKARIPTRQEYNCVPLVQELYEEWRGLQKNFANYQSESWFQEKEQKFISKLDNLFDIAHKDALKMIKIPEDKKFLLNQRLEGRVGYMYGIDVALAEKEERAEKKRQAAEERKKKSDLLLQELCETRDPVTELETGSASESESTKRTEGVVDVNPAHASKEDADFTAPGPSVQPEKRLCGTKHIMTSKLVASLDKCKISDREAVHLISAVVEAVGLDTASFTLGRTTIQRDRKKIRLEGAKKLRINFQGHSLQAAVIHWDGKLFPNDYDTKKHDRLAIIVTSGDIEKILAIPILTQSTGREQAMAIYGELLEWGLTDAVTIICCDTTASNLGHVKGAAVILEQMLGKDLLYCPCRHHIYELPLKAAFEIKIPETAGPNVPLFKRFKEAWPYIDKSVFKILIYDDEWNDSLECSRKEIIIFAENILKLSHQPRDDYEEFLKLTIVILGGIVKGSFRAPGAYHHARWMSKAIYTLKIYLFQEQFTLTSDEQKGVKDLCLFIVQIYVKAWFTAPLPLSAPSNDLNFIKKVIEYEKVDSVISNVVLSKISNHLWYLTPQNAAFSFFDEDISVDEKRKMVEALEKESKWPEGTKNIKFVNMYDLKHKEIHDFICNDTNFFFAWLELPVDFLNDDPIYWKDDENYKNCVTIVKKIKVVNDAAERGIKLIGEFEKTLTKDEEQRQSILQTVSEYRKIFKKVTKKSMLQEY